ncbi:MAG: fumarylacetoacetate hydrolase family protein [Planctomycetes bacterium]|nr:fumarylacetoacetate hydrolase family protein [Planctomycetota bacterium]
MINRVILIAGLVVCWGIGSAAAQALPVAAVGQAKGNPDANHERIVRYRINQGDVLYGILIDKHIRQLTNSFAEIARGRRDFSGARNALDKVKLLAPVKPSKIICFGWTFPSHAREVGGEERRKEPLVFLKPPTVIIAEKGTIVLPQKLSSQVEFEGELAAVIGKRMRNVAPERVMKGILGFTCMNDVTARDLTKTDPSYARGKGFDTFGPLGPWIVTHLDPGNLRIQTIQNGRIKQNARVSDMTFKIPFLISYISRVMTLLPGDVIAFGTPGGSGKLEPGDKIQVKIEKIGLLTNFVK